MPVEEIARNLGESKRKTIRFLKKIAQRGVSSSEEETGALFSRRMVRDEYISQQRKSAGSLGGNPQLLKQNASKTQAKRKQTFKQKPTPSSSSSSSLEEGNIKNSSITHTAGAETPKSAFGEFGHVRLSDSEFRKLRIRLNENLDAFINRLDRWGEEEPAKFCKKKSHYATILNWFDRDRKDGKISVMAESSPEPVFHRSHFCTTCESHHEWVCEEPTLCVFARSQTCPDFARTWQSHSSSGEGK